MKRFALIGALILGTAAFAAVVTYTYDDAGRLAKVDYGDGKSIAYTYDKSGNLLSRVVTGPPAPAPAAKKKSEASTKKSATENK